LRVLIDRDPDHSALYKVFLEVRDAAARILENTTLADLIARAPAGSAAKTGKKTSSRKTSRKKKAELTVLPTLMRGEA